MTATFLASLCMIGVMLSAPAQSSRLDKNLAKEKLKYDHAENAISRAKALGKLGREEYLAARQAVDAEKTNEALQFLKDYNQQAAETNAALLKTGVDPAKHSNGFRQLQISVRERERDLRELTRRVGFEQSQPFEALRKKLDELNQKLIQELFPRRAPNKETGEEDKNPQE